MLFTQKNYEIQNQSELFTRLLDDDRSILPVKQFVKKHGYDPEQFTRFLNQNVSRLNKGKSKFAKYKSMDDIISASFRILAHKDSSYNALTKVFYHAERNEICCTNAVIMAVIPCSYPLQENSYFYKDTLRNICCSPEKEHSKYPDYRAIIPDESDNYIVSLNDNEINSIRTFIQICKIINHEDKMILINGVMFNAEQMLNLIIFIKGINPSANIVFTSSSNKRAFTFRENNMIFLIMPCYLNDGELSNEILKLK